MASQKNPSAPAGRLATTLGADPHGISTCNLNSADLVVLREAGFEPLGLVIGSAVYHVGLQVGRWGQNQELPTLTHAMYQGRQIALGRMEAEAVQLGADGVVNLSLQILTHEGWNAPHVREFRVTGTAVRGLAAHSRYRRPDGRPFTYSGNPRGLYRILAAGTFPVALVFGTCVYHIAHRTLLQTLGQMVANQEVETLTAGLYQARELSLCRMQAEATQARATSIIAVGIETYRHGWGEHALEFYTFGEAIRNLDPSLPRPDIAPKLTFTLQV